MRTLVQYCVEARGTRGRTFTTCPGICSCVSYRLVLTVVQYWLLGSQTQIAIVYVFLTASWLVGGMCDTAPTRYSTRYLQSTVRDRAVHVLKNIRYVSFFALIRTSLFGHDGSCVVHDHVHRYCHCTLMDDATSWPDRDPFRIRIAQHTVRVK